MIFAEGALLVRRVLLLSILFGGSGVSGGCVDGFRGSNVQIDLSPGTPVQASAGVAPGPGELPSNLHFRIYAIDQGIDCLGPAPGLPSVDCSRLFEIQRFEIHKIVDVLSPCFIDVGSNVRFPGLHVSQFGEAVAKDTGIDDIANPPPGATEQQRIDAATALQRMANIDALGGSTGIKVVSSASASTYPEVDADCDGTGLPPPICTELEHNARRLAICEAAWRADPDLFEGTDRVLTAPLNGTTFGMVDGVNPISPAPIGGAQFFVDEALETIDEYAIYFQADGVAEPGTIMLTGTPTNPTRGVRHVHMTSPLLPTIVTAELAIFADLGEDDVHF